MHCKVTAHLTIATTAPAFAHKAEAVCTNCLLRAATCSGSCVRTADSDTLAPPRRRLTLLLCRERVWMQSRWQIWCSQSHTPLRERRESSSRWLLTIHRKGRWDVVGGRGCFSWENLQERLLFLSPSLTHCRSDRKASGTLNILNPTMLIVQYGAFSHRSLSFPLSYCLFSPDLLSAANPPSLKSLYIICIFLFIFYPCFFSLLPTLSHIFFGLSLLFMSPSWRMSWDIRSRMPASAAPGHWLSPRPILSLYLQPLEYIKTLYLFHLYVNAPSHSFLLCSPVAAENVPPFAPIFLSVQLDSPEMRCGKFHGSVEMLFYDHARSPSSPVLLIRFQRVVF